MRFIYSIFFDLGHAIINNDEKIFNQLISDKTANQLTKGGSSPLQLSIVCENYKFSYALLENKADPNYSFKEERTQKSVSLLQDALSRKNFALAKLLVYYGASLKSLNANSAYFKEIQNASDFYNSEIKPYTDQNTADANRKLAEAWQKVSEEEQESILKNCYQDKALKLLEKADKSECLIVEIGSSSNSFKQKLS